MTRGSPRRSAADRLPMWVYASPFCLAMCGGISSDSQIARTVPWIASGLRAAICSAMSAARSMQLVVRHDLAHQTEAQRGLGGEALLGTHQRPPQHVAERHAAVEHPDRLERRHDARIGMRVEERRVFAADDDVALVDEVLPAAGAHPLHRAHDRLPHLVGPSARGTRRGPPGSRCSGRTTTRRSSRRCRCRRPARRWPAAPQRGCRRCRARSPTRRRSRHTSSR